MVISGQRESVITVAWLLGCLAEQVDQLVFGVGEAGIQSSQEGNGRTANDSGQGAEKFRESPAMHW